MEDSSRQLRLSSTIRGFIIAALVAAYAYVTRQPEATLTASLLLAAGLQLAVLLLRKLVPPALMPQALYVFELLVDGATVLLFALGVYGGLLRFAADV
jgi:hypothetical protein